MTILIYDNEKIYTDSLCTSGRTVGSFSAVKVKRVETNNYGILLVAYAGCFGLSADLVRQLSLDREINISSEDVEAFAMTQDGGLLDFYGGVSTHLSDAQMMNGRWFGGSGSDHATAIMEHGESCPIKTIQTVCRINVSCGGDVISYSMDESGRLITTNESANLRRKHHHAKPSANRPRNSTI